MAAAEAAARLHAMQALEQEAYTFCVKTLGKVFQYTMQAKTSTDIKYSAAAALCRNDIYAILQLTMVMFIPPVHGEYSNLRAIEPDLSSGTLSNEAKAFIQYYQTKLASIRGTEEEEEEEEEVVPRSPSPAPIRRLSLGSSPATQLTQGTSTTREGSSSMGGRRMGGRRSNRSNHSRRKRRRSTSESLDLRSLRNLSAFPITSDGL